MKSNSKEIKGIQDRPNLAVRFANTVFVLGIVYSVLIAVYAMYHIYNPPGDASLIFYFVCTLSGGISAFLLGLCLWRLHEELKVNLSMLFITAGFSMYAFESYLVFYRSTGNPKISMAKDQEFPYDTRTYLEVLEDLREAGIEAYPNIFPKMLIHLNGLNVNNEKFYPLSGIPNTTTILSNESGYFPIIKTDEHGFNNPKNMYTLNNIDIALVGDSYTEGYSVTPDENICSLLRGFGYTALSFGKSDNSGFLELATLKEYTEPMKPKIVLWLYSIDDISELEINSSILREYLINPNFSQNLMSRSLEIREVLIKYSGQIEAKQKYNSRINSRIFKLMKLSNFRKLMIQIIKKPKKHHGFGDRDIGPISYEDNFSAYNKILLRANNIVSGWGGKLYFIYIPHYSRYEIGDEHDFRGISTKLLRETVFDAVTDSGIPLINLHKKVFADHPDKFSLYPFRMYGHFNAEGYRLVADAIAKRLKADGYVPSQSNNTQPTE